MMNILRQSIIRVAS